MFFIRHSEILLGLALTFAPVVAFAQPTAQKLLTNIPIVLNNTLIPVTLGIAFLIFVINAVRYFIFEGASDDGREKAKNLAVYGVLAFVFILTFWGLVVLVTNSLGFGADNAPCFDYGDWEYSPGAERCVRDNTPGS